MSKPWSPGLDELSRMSYREFVERTRAQAAKTRVPLRGMLCLTHRCNLACVHCYQQGSQQLGELTTEAWIDILEQATRAGCLWIGLTGGEPLLRADFSEIYRHAKSLGLLVTVMTNGSLIDEEAVDLFSTWPPHCVDLSLYAFGPGAYREITGRDVRQTVYAGVDALLRRRIRVTVKSVVLQQNADEIDHIRRWAEDRGLGYRTDFEICPTLMGAQTPKGHRLTDEQIIALERPHRAADRTSPRGAGGTPGAPSAAARRFNCGGGWTSFHVGPSGGLGICMLDQPVFQLGPATLLELWNGALRERRTAPLPPAHPCASCQLGALCQACPPLLRMETGSEEQAAEALCAMARKRDQALRQGAREARGGNVNVDA